MFSIILIAVLASVNTATWDDTPLQQHFDSIDSVGFNNLAMDKQRNELEPRDHLGNRGYDDNMGYDEGPENPNWRKPTIGWTNGGDCDGCSWNTHPCIEFEKLPLGPCNACWRECIAVKLFGQHLRWFSMCCGEGLKYNSKTKECALEENITGCNEGCDIIEVHANNVVSQRQGEMLGIYEKVSYRRNGKFVFKHKQRNQFLHFIKNNEATFWTIGPKVGVDIGGINNHHCDEISIPSTAHCQHAWAYYDNGEWHDDNSIIMTCITCNVNGFIGHGTEQGTCPDGLLCFSDGNCYDQRNPCVCKADWDASNYLASCANQKGCTDCDGSGYTWCHPTYNECDTVTRDGDGNSKRWFQCDKADECKTTEGNQPNMDCVFPFRFKDTEYESCITVLPEDVMPWCSTEVNSNGDHIQGQWGYCAAGCPGTTQV